MARPKLNDAERRRNQVNLALRDGELAELRRRAGIARMAIPDYLRQRALSERLRIAPPRQLGVAEFREVQRLAVNVNQMARALNRGAYLAAGAAHELAQLRGLLERLLPQEAD